jgi:hypothetical protein
MSRGINFSVGNASLACTSCIKEEFVTEKSTVPATLRTMQGFDIPK